MEEGTIVCAACDAPPDFEANFDIVRAGRGLRYSFPCKGRREGCKGSVTMSRGDIEEYLVHREAGKSIRILSRLDDVFEKAAGDAVDARFDAGERAAATHAAVAVSKLRLQVAGFLQKAQPMAVGSVQIANFAPNGPVAKELVAMVQERFGKSLSGEDAGMDADFESHPVEATEGLV